jgi:hypothetical protein
MDKAATAQYLEEFTSFSTSCEVVQLDAYVLFLHYPMALSWCPGEACWKAKAYGSQLFSKR